MCFNDTRYIRFRKCQIIPIKKSTFLVAILIFLVKAHIFKVITHLFSDYYGTVPIPPQKVTFFLRLPYSLHLPRTWETKKGCCLCNSLYYNLVVGLGFEPRKAWLADLQSVLRQILAFRRWEKGGVGGESFPPTTYLRGCGGTPTTLWGRREGERGLGGFVPNSLFIRLLFFPFHVFLVLPVFFPFLLLDKDLHGE